MERSENHDKYMAAKRRAVLKIAREFCTKLGVDEGTWDEIESTHDWLWSLLPDGTKFHSSSRFAEILVFHVLRSNGAFTDPAVFCKHAPTGPLRMFQRKWLLSYTEYLPDTLRQRKQVDPVNYTRDVSNSNLFSVSFKFDFIFLAKWVAKKSPSLSPKISAGVAFYIAHKAHGIAKPSMKAGLELLGIVHPGSVNNAVKRLLQLQKVKIDELVERFRRSRGHAPAQAIPVQA